MRLEHERHNFRLNWLIHLARGLVSALKTESNKATVNGVVNNTHLPEHLSDLKRPKAVNSTSDVVK